MGQPHTRCDINNPDHPSDNPDHPPDNRDNPRYLQYRVRHDRGYTQSAFIQRDVSTGSRGNPNNPNNPNNSPFNNNNP